MTTYVTSVGRSGRVDVPFRAVVDAVPMATVVLDRAGLVVAANRAFAELVNTQNVRGEPFLVWLTRANEREGFGRAFRALADREPGRGFSLNLSLGVGVRMDCVVRTSRIEHGYTVVTCAPISDVLAPEAELGLAVTRSLEALDQGVLLVDAGGKVVHSNPAAQDLIGKGIVGRSVLELGERRSVDVLTRALSLARSGSWQGEVILRRLDGETLPVEITMASGSGTSVLFLRDQREQRRREFEARLIAQVDRCLVAGDDPQKSVMAACAALADAVDAVHVAVLVHTRSGWQRWGTQAGELQRTKSLPEESTPPVAWGHDREVVMLSPDDKTAMAILGRLEGLVVVRIVLRASSGVVGHLLLTRRERSEWDARDLRLMATVAAQIALGLGSGLLTLETREMAAFQAMVLNQTSVLIGSVDERGCVVTWNQASEHLLGVSSRVAMGQRFGVEVGRASDTQAWSALWAELLDVGSVTREITLVRVSEGQEEGLVPLHLEGRVLGAKGAVEGAVFVGLDLRDRKALETQILQSQKLAAVGLLAAGIAHEINNPLSGVVGYSKMLLERSLPDAIRTKVEKIAQSGERCRKIVEGVLLFARQNEGGERRRVDLRSIVERVIAIGEYQWRVHNVRILRERDESVDVMADDNQLEQVVLNLLSNAVDAMKHGGRVCVSVYPGERSMAHLIVKDEGHGIPRDVVNRIFDPFFSTKDIGKGTGLGLAISYGIVQDHGGDILVDSHLGRGSCFTVLLPIADSPAETN